ncbi:MAG: flagellar type III secretion system pore protein FliP [Lachnospiraceae bacterium]|nr:flagellar type III secretion system pore protein FliP [Lachnospiraceae bacterium]
MTVVLLVCLLTFVSATKVSASSTHSVGDSDFLDATSERGDDVAPDLNKPKDDATGDIESDDPSLAEVLNDDLTLAISTNEGSTSLSSTLQILLMLTVLSLAPSILIMLTSFTRIIIVLHFVRSAIGMQTTPPNQILIGLALFLTFFIMTPTFNQIYKDAVVPLSKGEIKQEEAINKGMEPLRDFMFSQTNTKDIKLFMEISGTKSVEKVEDIPTTTLIPAFIISELRKAFTIGFLIYLPFLIMDMVVASTLMSMGMMMLPPTTISMPFKILLFIMVDGWNLVIGEVVKTFY